MGAGSRNRNRHITPESNGGKKCSKEMYEPENMKQSDYCIHIESPMEVKNLVKNKNDTIDFCPVDCVMTEWTVTHACPDCWGGDSKLNRSLASTSNINNRL